MTILIEPDFDRLRISGDIEQEITLTPDDEGLARFSIALSDGTLLAVRWDGESHSFAVARDGAGITTIRPAGASESVRHDFPIDWAVVVPAGEVAERRPGRSPLPLFPEQDAPAMSA
ncbi:hypothetical protein [Sphingomonas sp. LaA6.9]|uniref:hypothetical protein n=1 Tax=Sphingomonas sp. LaA6.9 TaxID=2919914 RepID=UPI001F4F220E|nr:hypothetical protein [Sphingomonas sp. LaA6.9]MCJ8159914.1 hypothetical protein [Sphingomonas sp. LaA6.9]